jgi:MFS family permease
MSFLGFACAYALRVNLSVALVAMLNDTEGKNNGTTWKYKWRDDSTVKGIVLSSFFYGYLTTQLMGGWLSQRFGGKRVFGYGVLCTSVLSMFSPVVVNASVWLLVALRILEGIGEGVTFSAMHSLLGQWAPPLERSVLSTFAYSGVFAGTVVALPISGVLSGTLGWPSVFYFFGALPTVLWSCLCDRQTILCLYKSSFVF